MAEPTIEQEFTALCSDIHKLWDSDQDSKVGKMLIAMSGGLPGYRPDIDAFRERLKGVSA